MLRVKSDKSDWCWSQSIVFTQPLKTGMPLGLARGPDISSAWQKGPLGTRLEICSVRPPRCAAILVYCSVRDWTRFLRHRIKKYPDSPVHTLSDSLRIYFVPHWRADLFFRIRCRIRRMRVDGSRIRKEKVADSKISRRGLRLAWILQKVHLPQKVHLLIPELVTCDC